MLHLHAMEAVLRACRWCAAGLLLGLSQLAPAQSYSAIEEAYADFLPRWEAAIAHEKVTGISWAIFTPDSLFIADANGFADKSARRVAKPSTIYRVGSITKLFTATLALQEIENGTWSLQTTWPALLPNIRIPSLYGTNDDITLRHLLSHQSGLPSDILKNAFTTYPNQPETLLEQLPATYTILPPGYMTVYSNIAYTVIGLALAKQHASTYSELLHRQIINPLKLTHTFLLHDSLSTQAYDTRGKVQPEPFIRDIPAGGLFSNVYDLTTFAQAWMKNTLVSATLQEAAWQKQNKGLLLDLEREQGLGWLIRTWGAAGKVVWHNGANQYHRSILALAPELNLGMVILSNDIRAEPLLSMAFHLLDAVGTALGRQARSSKNQWIPEALTPIEWSEKSGNAFAGRYIMPGYQFEVKSNRKGLTLHLPDQQVVLRPVDSNLFYPVVKKWLFLRQPEKQVLFSLQHVAGVPLMLRHQWRGKTERFGYKEPKGVPVSTAWQKRTGRYEVINKGKGEKVPFKDWKVYKQNGRLYFAMDDIRSGRTYSFLLNTLDDQMAVLLPVGRSSGEVVSVLQDNEGGPLLRVFGYILRKK